MAALALGACKVDTTTGASGGTSATVTTSATSGTGGEQAGVGGSGTGTTSSTATGAGGAAACLSCAVVITDPTTDPNDLCDSSGMIYDKLAACTCTGACATACGDNVCAQKPASADCQTCLQAASPAGCDTEFKDCQNDF